MKLAWQQIPSTVISDILCLNSLHGVVLDTEHGTFDPETLYACIQVITGNGKKAFVRLTEVSKSKVRLCLDAGASGLIFSTIESVDQARNAKIFSKYPSQGGKRGLGLVRQNRWGVDKLIMEDPILIAQIETVEGVKNVEKIWKSSTFNYVMIGPYDLTASLGEPGNFESHLYLREIEKVREIVPVKKMAVHIPSDVNNQLKKYEDFGIIALGMDTTFIIEKYRSVENA